MTRPALFLALPLVALLAGCPPGPSSFDLDATFTTEDGTATLVHSFDSEDPDAERAEEVDCSASTGTPPNLDVYIASDEAPGGDAELYSISILVEFLESDASLTRVDVGLFDARGAMAIVTNRSFATEDDGNDQDMAEGGCVMEGAHPDLTYSLVCDDTAPRPEYPAESLQFQLDWTCASWGPIYD